MTLQYFNVNIFVEFVLKSVCGKQHKGPRNVRPASCLLFSQIQEAVNMAPQLFDCTVPLKVFSFQPNTDCRRVPRVSEAPFQQSDSLPSPALFQSNNNAETRSRRR